MVNLSENYMKYKQLQVTKTFLPSLSEYEKYLKVIWKSGWVTNNGQLVRRLEIKLKKYLNTSNLFLVANGTIGLQISIKALNLTGDIITTPFTYIATTSSIIWENCRPVFVDIDPKTLCIDANKIESSITEKTQAILAVHIFGNPCDIEKIQRIAEKYHLKVIYDAAHAFGVRYKEKSILNFGDISVLSFHAAKIFHTAEGGAIICNDSIAKKVSYMRNFGHKGYDKDFYGLGINGKNSEFHAALGLSLIPKVEILRAKRKEISEMYNSYFIKSKLKKPQKDPQTIHNYSYYPIIFESESQLLIVKKTLQKNNIYSRRYFYPSLNTVRYITARYGRQPCPISEDITKRVLCLPLSHHITDKTVQKISSLVLDSL